MVASESIAEFVQSMQIVQTVAKTYWYFFFSKYCSCLNGCFWKCQHFQTKLKRGCYFEDLQKSYSDYFPNFLVINLIKRNMFILHCSLALEVLYERSRTIHLQRYVLDLFKQLSNLFARIINFYKSALLFFQKYHHGCLKGSDYTSDLL